MNDQKFEIETFELSFKSGKETCAASLFIPSLSADSKHTGSSKPACIVCANTMGATKLDRLDEFAKRFAQAGIAALTFDYRSFGNSSGLPRQVCDIPGQVADFHAAINFAKTLTQIEPTRIGLWGASLAGGHVVTVGSTRTDIKAIVSLAPTSDCTNIALTIPKRQLAGLVWASNLDLIKMLLGRRPHYVPLVALPGHTAAMNTPGTLEDYLSMIGGGSSWKNQVAARLFLQLPLYRPIAKAKKVFAPLLVGVCDQDDVASPKLAKKMASLAPDGYSKHYPAKHLNALLEPLFEQVVTDQIEFFRSRL